MSYNLVFFDTETTGNTDKDYLCQIAWRESNDTKNEIQEGLFKPPIPITVESMAVCHVTNKMVADKPPFQGSELCEQFKKLAEDDNNVFVAHNAKFDIGMMRRENIIINNYIDTLKIARFIDREGKLPKYSLQYLRYLYEIDVEATAHDAGGDIIVLEALFEYLKKEASVMLNADGDELIKKMMTISFEPFLMRTFTFGKHVGKSIEEVAKTDAGYLVWLLEQKEKAPSDTEEDWIYTLRYYLKKLAS